MVDLTKIRKVHFTGIGGIGMSALARMLLHDGKVVSGSDREYSQILENLRMSGVVVFEGHDAKNVTDSVDLLIYSQAIPEDNAERKRARALGIPTRSYAELLGILSEHRYTIAVSGSHGKTTTTAMVWEVLREVLHPTLIVGSLLQETGSNFAPGDSEPASTHGESPQRGGYFVVEACEYRRSFLHLHPNILVITNIDADHLDYYKDLDDIKRAFAELVQKVPEDGFVVCDPSDAHVRDVLVGTTAGVIDATSYRGDDIELPFPAEHNVENATRALAVSDIFDVPREDALMRLKRFKGTWRRMERKGVMRTGALLYDDYAHHPTEIAATLTAFRAMYPDKRLVVAFQPHLHSRTEHFFGGFVNSLSLADRVLLAPVYEARAENKSEYTSAKLAGALAEVHRDVISCDSFDAVVSDLLERTNETDVVIIMGAGDLYTIGKKLVQ